MDQARATADDMCMAHLLTTLSVTVLFYAAVTRGGLAFAWALGRLVRS